MKKNLIFTTVFLIFLSGVAKGQTKQNDRNGEKSQTYGMYFQAGPSFPLFDLGKSDPTDNAAGMASVGYHVEIGYTHQVTNNLGFKVSSFYFGNPYSTHKFNSYYEGFTSGATYGVGSSQGWSVGGLLLKPYFYVPINDNLTWEFYVAGGLSAYYTPKFQIARKTALPNATVEYYYRDQSKGVSFIYGLGTQVNFRMFRKQFFASAELLYDPLKYNASGTDYSGQSYSTEVHSRLGYASVNLGYIIYF